MLTGVGTAKATSNSGCCRPKLAGFAFYEKVLGSPKYVVAPMVDASELAWRLLSRRHGAQLCYSPMFHSSCFTKDHKYRKDSLQSCPEDRPLIIQFCGNDPKVLLEAALLAQDHCDAIDINLGCPQAIAKRGHYGAFLQDEWDLLKEIVATLHKHLSVPVTCKIRIFEDIDKTIRYAKMLEAAGCQMLTVHGRTREQKGPLTGVAEWSYVKKLREVLKIPLLSNGNIMSVEDIHRCLEETGVNGVMTAEGNLFNPFLFEGVNPTAWSVAYEYLDIVEKYPAPISYIRGHLFKVFHHLMNLTSNAALREEMAICHNVPEFRAIVKLLEQKYLPFHEGRQKWTGEASNLPSIETPPKLDSNLSLPPWLCQPYIRAAPEVHRQKLEEASRLAADPNREKRAFYDQEGNEISRKKMKKMRRVQRRPNRAGLLPGDPEREPGRRFDELCKNGKIECTNPMGLKCDEKLCRVCCKNRCFHENLDCVGHKLFIKSRRNKAIALTAAEKEREGSNNDDRQQLPQADVVTES
ncbi:tRNA-dihydrouridine(16/17) synthase [NAD(P)(+)]-like [Topomyia yanbarensis]|uniref:tRNA-dihydrouridine(16/17) synthase [NAD(P)(+)]-like n=1 Tax=Topomyia yanbarensis TaxID=2498891 RepID=UPI00273B5B1D|nr:tRNA-dihydrouridine(16/17) synthase [NAD(P)(+)]-like [Topomyia yanbarensis]XP_058820787.1 tRNA-dihydrouridine(16/17) synthase [NAD(P)(+)]-like [Topomyia yanbarensis]